MHVKKPHELLINGLKDLGLTTSEIQINAFMTYLFELKKWNKVYNLTGLKEDRDIIVKHFFDSLLYLKVIPDGEVRIADIGSGAGFPGIPIKIIRPEIEIYLVEPSRKKSAFLRHIISRIGLKEIEVIEKGIEQIKVKKELPELVDVAVTRALFNIKDFLKKASHIVRRDGIFILNKGPKAQEETKMLGDMSIKYEILKLALPFSGIERFIVVINP